MGIDWFSCESCGETFPDCGEYVGCDCGRVWCCEDCAAEDGFLRNEDAVYPEPESTCKYCRNEDFDDSILLKKALEMLKISRENLVVYINEPRKEQRAATVEEATVMLSAPCYECRELKNVPDWERPEGLDF